MVRWIVTVGSRGEEGGDPDAEEDGSNEDNRDEPHDGEEDDMSSSL